uniref:Ig-like domain-containing protein n=1 Tax=Sinocyclocheilus rhinocerous TaxID=307959 RepID=A0A673FZ29_9TELE
FAPSDSRFSNMKPSVSLLPPSSLQISGDSAALLCLLSSYSPQGALVSWTLDGSEVTEGVVTSAESEQDGRYSRSSVLTLSKARWEEGELYVCRETTSSTFNCFITEPVKEK